MPGRLSVSRTFGDLEAKVEKFGGNPNVVIAVPDVKSFAVSKEHDFIGLASDGIFDKINNREFIKCVWNSLGDGRAPNAHQQIGRGVEYILKNSLLRKTLDNVTVVLVGFESFRKICGPEPTETTLYEDSDCGEEASNRVRKKL
jgi:protein phosphatase 2C family protein 2/3